MAKPNTIEIEFRPKGDAKLIDAIKKLDRATKSLLNSQAKLIDKEVKRNKTSFKGRQQLKGMFLDLKKLSLGFKDTGISTEMFTRALKGDRVALRQTKEATDRLIASKTRLKKGMLDTEHSTRILGGSFAVLRSKMLLASFAGGIFSATIGKLARLAGDQEQAERRLTTALGRRSNALIAFAAEQQKVTRFGDEETIQAMSLVGAYTDNEKAIAKLTKASMDLAVAKGMDLSTATDLVSKSVFSSTNALSRYGVEIVGTQGSVERLENATKALADLYGGQAQEDGETFNSTMMRLGNSVGDLGERFGIVLIPAVTLFANAIQKVADSIDTEEIKSYGAALLGVGGAYLIVANATTVLAKGIKLVNKLSKRQAILFVAMMGVGKLIEQFDIFADKTGDLSDEMKKLEGELSKQAKLFEAGAATQGLENEIELLRLRHDLMVDGNINLSDRLELLKEEEAQLASSKASEEEKVKKEEELGIKRIELEEQIKQAKLSTVSTTLGAFSNLMKQNKATALAAKRLAQVQAVIDTYAAANAALKSGIPPFNYVAMAGVIAQGLANVAQIEAQKFAKGGEFITTKPELIMVGEAGREHVQITPIDRPQDRALKNAGVTVNIQGGVVDQDYITNTLIPAINASGQIVA